MPPQHGPLPEDDETSTAHVPLYKFYPPPRRSSLVPHPLSRSSTPPGSPTSLNFNSPPTSNPTSPKLPPTSPKFTSPPPSPVFATPQPKSYRRYAPTSLGTTTPLRNSNLDSPSYPSSPLSPSTPKRSFTSESPSFPFPTLTAPYVREQSKSPCPSIPFSVNSTDPLPITPTGTHLSYNSTARSSQTAIFKGRGVSVYDERSTWEKDDDDGSDKIKKGVVVKVVELELRKRKWWWLGVVAGLAVFTIALGAGLGIGLQRRHHGGAGTKNSELQPEQTTAPVVIVATPTQVVSTTTSLPTVILPTAIPTNSTSTLHVMRTTTQSSIVYAVFETTIPAPEPSSDTSQRFTRTSNVFRTTSISSTFSKPTCPSPQDCNAPGCVGQNQIGQLGWCTKGPSAGCGCISICGPDMGSCDAVGCQGLYGFCEVGDWRGCPCQTE